MLVLRCSLLFENLLAISSCSVASNYTLIIPQEIVDLFGYRFVVAIEKSLVYLRNSLAKTYYTKASLIHLLLITSIIIRRFVMYVEKLGQLKKIFLTFFLISSG